MDILETARARIRGRGCTVVFPEAGDERIVAAARRLEAEGLAEPIVLDPSRMQALDRYAALDRTGRPEAERHDRAPADREPGLSRRADGQGAAMPMR